MIKENRNGVFKIIEILNPLILGKHVDGFTCNCGCISANSGIATKIEPSGDEYQGQELEWYLWSVSITCPITGKRSHSRGLSHFINSNKLDEIFKGNFMDLELRIENSKKIQQLYKFPIIDESLILETKSIIKIKEGSTFTKLIINWNKEQKISKIINENIKQLNIESVVKLIDSINPEFFIGGPIPELEYESNWNISWNEIKSKLTNDNYSHMFLRNIVSRNMYNTETSIIFTKR